MNEREPAFPHLASKCQRVNESEYYEGLSVRDYFAAAVMTGALAGMPDRGRAPLPEDLAKFAYVMADAMIEERAR